MHCPFCSGTSSVVKDSRGTSLVRRRRLCTQCGEKFTTQECVSFPRLNVVKDSSTQEFNRGILLGSIKEAFLGNFSDLDAKLEEIFVLVVKDLDLLRLRKVRSSQITDSVIKALCGIDKIIAMRFAVLHKDFESFEQLLTFVENL